MLKLKRNSLSVALVSATLMVAGDVHAQSAEEPAQDQSETATTDDAENVEQEDAVLLDSVRVTGIRRGIEDAIDTKQSEGTIVEAISAEDIGKLPDTSIADSIARLPGLTAQRFGGRPQEINIRGFAGDFSTTLLNGREQVSLGNNRGVEFDQYPSELISSVVVHKTTDAALVGQGLSGTVNLKTVRPLSFGERVIAVNLRGDMNKVDDQKEYGNRYSASYIDQFADNTIGVALGYAHLNNPGQSHQYGSWGYSDAGELSGSDIFALEDDNERDGLAATLEWKPNEVFSSTLDLFYSKFDKEQSKKGVQFGLAQTVATRTSENGTVLEGSAALDTAILRNDYNAALDDLFSLGWGNKLDIDEHWTLTTDVSYSRGNREETILETYAVRNAGQGDVVSYAYNPDGFFDFDFGFDFTDLGSFSLMDPGGWGVDRAQAGYLKNFEVEDELTAVRIDLERRFDEGILSTLEFGANLTDRGKSRSSFENTLCITPECVVNVPGAIPTNLATNTSLEFAGLSSFLALDPQGLVDDVYFLRQKGDKDIANKNWDVNEKVGTFYVQANINTDLGAIPIKGNIGVQVVNVDQDSSGFQTFEGNPFGNEISGGTSYLDYLPSLNLSAQFPADQYLRFGASRAMARPRLDEMRANDTIAVNRTRDTTIDPVTGLSVPDPFWERNGGNPELEPWLANAYDLSYEKYFGGNKGYVSVAYFFKDLKTYIYNQVTPFDIRDTTVPASVYLAPGTPEEFIGEFSRPENGDGGTIKGLELAISIPFDMLWAPLQGFGFVGSYSDTQSSIQPRGPGTTDVLPGLSKYVSNATVYYERYGFSTRVSQRSRSAFVGEVQGFGGDRSTFFFDGEKVIDFQMGYTFQSGPLENLSFLLQVNNVTDEPFRRFNTFSDRPAQFTEYGRTYLFGVNYKF